MAEEQRSVIIDVKVNNDKAVDAMLDYQAAIESVKSAQRALKKQMEETKEAEEAGTITAEEARITLAQQRRELVVLGEKQKGYTTLLRQSAKEVQNNITEQTRLEGSLASLRAKLSNLTAEYDNLSREDRTSERGEALKAEINAVTDELKGSEEETQRFYRNVGNYANAMQSVFTPLFPELQKIRTSTQFLSQAFLSAKASVVEVSDGFTTGIEDAKAFAGAQRALAVATTSLKTAWALLNKVLIASAIGALVAVLGSLVVWLTRSQKGIEFVSKAMAGIGAAVDVVIDRVTRFGSALANIFSGNFKQAVQELKATFAGFGQELAEETKQAWRLKEALIDIEKQEAIAQARRAAAKVEIAELKRISDDQTKSEQERIEAAKKALAMETREAQEAKRLGELRIANMLGFKEVTADARKTLDELGAGAITADEAIKKIGLSESTLTDLQALVAEYEKFKQKEQEFTQMQVEGTTKLNTIHKEAAEKRKAMLDKEVEELRAAIDLELEAMAEGFEKERAQEEERYRRQVEDLRNRLATESDLTLKAREAINRQIEIAEKLHYQRMGAIGAEEQAMNLAKEQAHQAMLSEMGKKMTESTAAGMQELEAEMAAMDAQIDEDNRLRWENLMMEAKLRGENTLELEKQMIEERLNSLHQLEGESEEEFRNRQLQDKMALAEKEQEITEYRLGVANAHLASMGTITDALGQLSQAIGEDSAAGAAIAKVVGLAQVGINTGVAISNIIAAATADPTQVSVFQRIATIATGVISVIANMATALKYIKGAKVPGHSGDGGGGSSVSSAISSAGGAASSIPTVTQQLAQQSQNVGYNVPYLSNQATASVVQQESTAQAMRNAVEGVQIVASWTEGQEVGKRVRFVESLGDV